MFRPSLLAVTLFLAACGIDPAVPALQEEPLVAATPAPELVEITGFTQLTPRIRQVSHLQPALDTVSVHSLAVPDGTEVRFLLGMMGCGISVVSRGSAIVQGGAFEIAYDSSLSEFGQMSLFFQVGGGTCDPETSQVYEVATTLPGTIDLSTLPEQSFVGCWLFDE